MVAFERPLSCVCFQMSLKVVKLWRREVALVALRKIHDFVVHIFERFFFWKLVNWVETLIHVHWVDYEAPPFNSHTFPFHSLTLGKGSKKQNGNLEWHLPLGVGPPWPQSKVSLLSHLIIGSKLIFFGSSAPCSRMCTFWSSFGRSQFTIVKCGEILRGSLVVPLVLLPLGGVSPPCTWLYSLLLVHINCSYLMVLALTNL